MRKLSPILDFLPSAGSGRASTPFSITISHQPDLAFKSTLLVAVDVEGVVGPREGADILAEAATMPPPISFRPDRSRQE
jgi:hypothetical protein